MILPITYTPKYLKAQNEKMHSAISRSDEWTNYVLTLF